jgi:hypothetical protein
MLKPIAVLCTVLGLSGCAGVTPELYQAQTPVLDLPTYFNGPLTAWGYFAGRSGEVKRRFTVKMTGVWQGKQGTLTEHFSWSDGTHSERVWHLTQDDAHHYTGRAADVVGEAKGVAYGNALQWRYTLLVPVDGTTYALKLDDWMYQMDDEVLMNHTVLSKFGVRVGELFISFRKGS